MVVASALMLIGGPPATRQLSQGGHRTRIRRYRAL